MVEASAPDTPTTSHHGGCGERPEGVTFEASTSRAHRSPSPLPTLQKDQSHTAGSLAQRGTGGWLRCDALRMRPLSQDNSCKRKTLY